VFALLSRRFRAAPVRLQEMGAETTPARRAKARRSTSSGIEARPSASQIDLEPVGTLCTNRL
jgi:hypothetical protein